MDDVALAIFMALLTGVVIWLIKQEGAKRMAEAAEAAAKLDAISASLTKIGSESSALMTQIDELKALANGKVPDDVMAKINAVAAQAQTVDDLVPDATP